MKFKDINGNTVDKPDDTPIKKKVSVYGLLVVGDYTLLTRDHGLSFHEPPGGTIEHDESDLEGLAREIQEETGIVVDTTNSKLLGQTNEYFYDAGSDIYYDSTRKVFSVQPASSNIDITAIFTDEIASVGFYHTRTLPELPLQDFIRDLLY